jgi:hypothetical protein
VNDSRTCSQRWPIRVQRGLRLGLVGLLAGLLLIACNRAPAESVPEEVPEDVQEQATMLSEEARTQLPQAATELAEVSEQARTRVPEALEEARTGVPDIATVLAEEASTSVAEAVSTLEEISINPASFVGEDVRVEGEVQRLLAPRVFSIQREELLNVTDDVLVIALEPQADLSPGMRVQVRGQVQLVTRDDLQERVRFELPEAVYEQFDNRPVIIAHSVTVM